MKFSMSFWISFFSDTFASCRNSLPLPHALALRDKVINMIRVDDLTFSSLLAAYAGIVIATVNMVAAINFFMALS
jgi:hypothetical protein